jgi:branched-subunit amino acid ABC-type transport system permease component
MWCSDSGGAPVSDFLPFVFIGLTSGSVYGLAGTGLVLTYKTSGIFNFSHGTVAALMAYAFYDLNTKQGLHWSIALAICLLVLCPLVGLLLERIARRLAEAPVAMKIVATVGLLVGVQQLIVVRYGAALLQTKTFLPTNNYKILGVNVGADQFIVMAIALGGMIGLTIFLRTPTGLRMRAVVDQPDLLALTGTSPVRIRRQAWMIGTVFAGISGILLAPTVGLDVTVLTLLVIYALGGAAIGMFTSIPLTYAGGLIVGVLGALATKYVATITWLSGLPSSLPFIILFAVLVFAPSKWLVDFSVDRKAKVVEPRHLPRTVKIAGGLGLAVLLLRLPDLVTTRLPVYTSGLAYVLIFLSLALLIGTSGQVSLATLAFAAVGAAASARLATDAGLPWLLAVLFGSFVAVPVGALLAIPAIRRSGLYLALATFGFAVLLERLVFGTNLMFGASSAALSAPRPSFASGDDAYFFVVLAFVVAAIVLVTLVHRSRLGRLLRAMADSPTALTTSGTSVTAIKVIVFCISAFLAGLGGALLSPVTGSASAGTFNALISLTLVVILVVATAFTGGSEVLGSILAAAALMVLPTYSGDGALTDYQPVFFGLMAVLVAMSAAGMRAPNWLVGPALRARKHPDRSPAAARVAIRPQPEGAA